MDQQRFSVHASYELAEKYKDKTSEKQFAESFWVDFFKNICGIDDLLAAGIEPQFPVRDATTGNFGWIDIFWPGVLLIEHKSSGKSLDKAEQQARQYLISLNPIQRPPVIILCNFSTFRIVEVLAGKSFEFELRDLPENVHRFESIIGDAGSSAARVEFTVDVEAAKLMSDVYVQFEKSGYSGHEVSTLLIRILFLLFGDDTGMWKRTEKGYFSDLVHNSSEDGAGLGAILQELFFVLNTPVNERSPIITESLSGFPYVNGGLFAEIISIFNFNKAMRGALVQACSYDWANISPAIFGSLFQNIQDAEKRREMGEHYTSEINILKSINDLFLNDLYTKIQKNWDNPRDLKSLRIELGQYKFLDPACGSGNFLVVAYKKLRELELKIIARVQELENKKIQLELDGSFGLQVHLGQFFGIEFYDWSASIARVAMFIADHQANLALEQFTGAAPNRFPLTESAVIHNHNALRVDWSVLCPIDEKTFIIGNPPFVGARLQTPEQKSDTHYVWLDSKGSSEIDYVSNWYLIAARHIAKYGCRASFVSTNSITQGEQPAIIWKELNKLGIVIDFAHRTFKWTNDASNEAAVHVVIIGFSREAKGEVRRLWEYIDVNGQGKLQEVPSINAYLVDGPQVLIESRTTPIQQGTAKIDFGSMPNDGGFLSNISSEDADIIRSSDPIASKYLRRIIGAQEMLHNTERFCLWLLEAKPNEIKQSKVLFSRVESVRKIRADSKRAATQKLANKPTEFGEIRQPLTPYLVVPIHTAQNREYVPMAYFEPDIITNNSVLLISSGDLTLFGILQSRVFNVWNKSVSGRIKSDTRISSSITYNNFPFPTLTNVLREKIQSASKEVLAVRKIFLTESLADLYDPVSMPKELRKAHIQLDTLVLQAFELTADSTDSEIMARLFFNYKEIFDSGLF
jgi:hypothetical protein